MGRPSKFTPEVIAQVKVLAELGKTEKQITEAVGISVQTLTTWKNKNPEFWASLKDWKSKADEEVEKSLKDMAIGYEREGRWYPPSPIAAFFWLKNRKPQEWRDRHEFRMSEEITEVTSASGSKEEV